MTAPTDPRHVLDAEIISELNALLQVDHEALAAYTAAIRALSNIGRRETVVRFRADHERHIESLTRAIRRAGGTPVDASPSSDAAFVRAMGGGERTAADAGGDRAVMAAFVSHETRTSEAYTRAVTRAGAWPADVRAIVETAADDESRHYEWASEQLASLGPAPAARLQHKLGETADRLEAATKRGIEAARRGATAVRERLPDRLPARLREIEVPRPSSRALAVGAVAAGISFAVTVALASSLRKRG